MQLSPLPFTHTTAGHRHTEKEFLPNHPLNDYVRKCAAREHSDVPAAQGQEAISLFNCRCHLSIQAAVYGYGSYLETKSIKCLYGHPGSTRAAGHGLGT